MWTQQGRREVGLESQWLLLAGLHLEQPGFPGGGLQGGHNLQERKRRGKQDLFIKEFSRKNMVQLCQGPRM